MAHLKLFFNVFSRFTSFKVVYNCKTVWSLMINNAISTKYLSLALHLSKAMVQLIYWVNLIELIQTKKKINWRCMLFFKILWTIFHLLRKLTNFWLSLRNFIKNYNNKKKEMWWLDNSLVLVKHLLIYCKHKKNNLSSNSNLNAIYW